ncbi:MAG: hypothetical protein ACKVYV_09445 [Limisphaerales bacterium]
MEPGSTARSCTACWHSSAPAGSINGARALEEFSERERRARLAEALAGSRPAYGPDVGNDYWPVFAAAAVAGELLD